MALMIEGYVEKNCLSDTQTFFLSFYVLPHAWDKQIHYFFNSIEEMGRALPLLSSNIGSRRSQVACLCLRSSDGLFSSSKCMSCMLLLWLFLFLYHVMLLYLWALPCERFLNANCLQICITSSSPTTAAWCTGPKTTFGSKGDRGSRQKWSM